MTFEKVYNDHNKDIFTFFFFKTRDRELSEELTQDVFMRVHKHLGSYDSEKSSMSTWLHNIAGRILIDVWRKKKEELVHISEYVDDNERETFQITTGSDAEKEMIRLEYRAALAEIVDGLKKPLNHVARLHYFEGYKINEISRMAKMNDNTVKVNLFRARAIIEGELVKRDLTIIPS